MTDSADLPVSLIGLLFATILDKREGKATQEDVDHVHELLNEWRAANPRP